jgi:hypothetical protein
MMKIQAPMSKRDCVAYIVKLERLEKRGKSSEWVTQKLFYSNHFIYLNDGGDYLAAIDLGVCDIKGLEDSSSQTFHREEDLRSEVRSFLRAEKLMPEFDTGFFKVAQKFRLSEKVFLPKDTLYAMGTAVPAPTHEKAQAHPDNILEETITYGKTTNRHQQELSFAEMKLARDPEIVSRYDANGDRKLDEKERGELRKDLQQQIKNKPAGSYYLQRSKFCLTSSEVNRKLFGIDKVVLTTYSEKSLSNRLLLKAWLSIIAAPLLMLAGIFILQNVVK